MWLGWGTYKVIEVTVCWLTWLCWREGPAAWWWRLVSWAGSEASKVALAAHQPSSWGTCVHTSISYGRVALPVHFHENQQNFPRKSSCKMLCSLISLGFGMFAASLLICFCQSPCAIDICAELREWIHTVS